MSRLGKLIIDQAASPKAMLFLASAAVAIYLVLHRISSKSSQITSLLLILLSISGWNAAARFYRRLSAATAQPQIGFNRIDSSGALDWFNTRPLPPHSYRILFIGDSLTLHVQAPGIWDQYCGMAATSSSKDFVHLSTRHIQEKLGDSAVELYLDNGGNGKLGAMFTYLRSHPEIRPDLVVLQGGENDPFDNSFPRNYCQLLDLYPAPKIVLGDWWSDEKSSWEQSQAAARKLEFVDLRKIDRNPNNSGNDGPFHIRGVADHPSDNGHAMIADGIDLAFDHMRRSKPE